ncbi:MAG TPA: arginine--tRNA ligase [Candidatus Methylacidiphilales bacterium]|nr:arginine--tRNA ligase [Candidatus Methylacidiphilales bacterium]
MIPTPRQEVEALVAQSVKSLFGDRAVPGPYVRPCPDARHGDFQTNAAMVQAKTEKANPRDLAQKIVDACGENDIVSRAEIAGPGFVNFRLKPAYAGRNILARLGDERLGCGVVDEAKKKTIVVDYSGPNVAKELHVGHLRSTILGDALSRIFRFQGQTVITDNHIGDWGTQFGMVLWAYKNEHLRATYPPELLDTNPLEYLESIYVYANAEAKLNPEIREAAKAELLKLQSLDPENKQLWERFVGASTAAMRQLYIRMGITFDHENGESFYNEMLAPIVKELIDKGIAQPSEGAVCIFFEDNEYLKDKPFVIQKTDGAFLYSTTDLATLKYRTTEWKADSIVYVTDGRQQTHFQQLFAAARKWGIDAETVKLEHVWFGSILGPNRKALSTRGGGTFKLRDLLEEAETRALAIIKEKRNDLTEEEGATLARILGIGAVKYADMAQNRNLDYIFDWDKLLAFDGNTAPYLINAYVRTQALFRKAGIEPTQEAYATALPSGLVLEQPAELTLAKKLMDFEDSVNLVSEEGRPHYLCVYLFDLATTFHHFYENCPILVPTNSEEVKMSRLALTSLTARTLKLGLSLLGIETVDRM